MGSLGRGELVARRSGASRGSGLLGGDASGFSLRRVGFGGGGGAGWGGGLGVREKEILCHSDTFLHGHLGPDPPFPFLFFSGSSKYADLPAFFIKDQ